MSFVLLFGCSIFVLRRSTEQLQVSRLFPQHLLCLGGETGRKLLGHFLLLQQADFLGCDGTGALFCYAVLGRTEGGGFGRFGEFGSGSTLGHCAGERMSRWVRTTSVVGNSGQGAEYGIQST